MEIILQSVPKFVKRCIIAKAILSLSAHIISSWLNERCMDIGTTLFTYQATVFIGLNCSVNIHWENQKKNVFTYDSPFSFFHCSVCKTCNSKHVLHQSQENENVQEVTLPIFLTPHFPLLFHDTTRRVKLNVIRWKF